MSMPAWPRTTRALVAPKPLAFGVVATLMSALLQAIPTAVIPNPFFVRMTPVRAQDYIFLAASSVLIGLVFSTFGVPKTAMSCQSRAIGGGILSTLAIGCPICNHVVVVLIGITGALTYWAPLQPVVGAAAIVILVWTLRKRVQAIGPNLASV